MPSDTGSPNGQKTNHLEVSAGLMKEQNLEWVQKQIVGSALVGGILSVIHPELYSAGIEGLTRLKSALVYNGHRLPEILRVWSSPFTVLTVISNRETPFHRDNGGAHPWFDILVPLGIYEHGRIEFPGLGIRLKYDPGTVVGLTGRVVQHGVTCPGDRACLAYHMKSTVIEELGIVSPSWVNLSHYSIL